MIKTDDGVDTMISSLCYYHQEREGVLASVDGHNSHVFFFFFFPSPVTTISLYISSLLLLAHHHRVCRCIYLPTCIF